MTQFFRALRLALRYRLLVALSIVCSLLVGLLWGGNIGAIYPFVVVAIHNESLQDWLDSQIAAAQDEAARQRQSRAVLEEKLAAAGADRQPEIRHEIALVDLRLAAEQAAIDRYRLVEPLVDGYVPRDPFQTLLALVGLLMLGTIVKNLFLFASCMLENKLAQLVVYDLSKLMFRRSLRMDQGASGADGPGQLVSRFTFDMECLSGGLKTVFGKMTREPLKMAACLIGAGCVCWRLLLFSLLVAPLAGYLIRRLGKLMKRANRRAMEEMSLIYAILEEVFQGIKIVKAFTMERFERRRFFRQSRKYLARSMRIAFYDSLTRPSTEFLGMSTICLALLAGAYLVLKQQTELLGIKMCDRPLEMESLLLFYGLLAGVADPARKLSEVFGRIQRAAAASDRIFSLVDREPTIVDARQTRPLPRHRKQIAFEGVRFGYRPDNPVLFDFSLTIPFGETLAVVGPNGCGKSTLINLLLRFYDPDQGALSIDGLDLRQARLKELRQQIGLVTQETLLFDDTVYNNLLYGSPHATRQQVLDASKQAHAHRFIEERLEQGFDTKVGPRGERLSGGQRQRIALARAMLRDPAILVLDEATSQIDLESEQLIHEALRKFARDRTTIIVTHRMGMLALADRILVMNAGHIVGLGTHDELLRHCDLYRRLYDIQFREIA